MKRYAVIDIGTTSTKLHVAEKMENGNWRRIVDRAEITLLGEGLHATGEIQPAAALRTVAAISGMVEESSRLQVQDLVAVGTMACRTATNFEYFALRVAAACGVKIRVLSGEEESRLSYLGATSGIPVANGPMIVFDIGGGSTEFVRGTNATILESFSVNVGAMRFTETYQLRNAVSPERLPDILGAIAVDLRKLERFPASHALLGIGGTVTTMASVLHTLETYDPDAVHGTRIDGTEVDRQIELYRSRSAEERRSIPGLQPGRAEVILGGACIVRSILTALRATNLTVSDRGLRHGVLLDRFSS
ncbi:MAG: Ppx/GppA family phosphatase [Bacteroidetes bacterium]|nr:Ppx/GppA family phosphatase [Bacteroidota bacterium]